MPWRACLLPAALLAAPTPAQQPVRVQIQIRADRIVNTMRGGMGASWHAIDGPLPGKKQGELGSYSGSAWGANPPADDEGGWRQLYRHADWLGFDWLRVEIEQRMYEPRRRQFSWDNAEMRALYRILDWAEERRADVFLQQMWANVDWNAHLELRADPVGRLRSGPHSMEDFAYGLGELVEHLVRRKGYRSIRWLSINNEPGHDSFSWWQDGKLKALSITPGLAAVRRELDRRGIDLPLSGPDWTDLPVLDPPKIDFDAYIGAYDLHSYFCGFDSMPGGYPLHEAGRRLKDWVQWAHGRGKPFFLSELGTMLFGWGNEDTGPSSYEAGLKDAALVVRGLNAGVDGFNRWSFTNRGDLDGQWQLVDTWDIDAGRLLAEFRPRPNVYYLYGLLARFTAKYSKVAEVAMNAPFGAAERKLAAAALVSPRGNLTLIAVNESHRPARVEFAVSGLTGGAKLYRYAVTSADRDKAQVPVARGGEFSVAAGSGGFPDEVPAGAVVVYTTYRLDPEEPGIAAE